MHIVPGLAFGLLSSVSIAAAARGQCGTLPPSLELRSISKDISRETRRTQIDSEPVTVKTYVHVLADDDTVEGGYYGVSNSNAFRRVMQFC